MRTATLDGRFCIVTEVGYVDVAERSGGRFGPDPVEVYPVWDQFREWAADADLSDAVKAETERLGPPSPRPAQVFAVGLNYGDHAAEVGSAIPATPSIFTKFVSSLAGPYGVLVLPEGKVDWEVELVAVMGRAASRIAPEEAWDHVAGLTIGQDFSERVGQLAGDSPQYSLAKSHYGFGPTGPCLVTVDEFANPDDLAIECLVNGETVQSARTSSMLIGVPDLISRLSAVCDLYPGDLIFTGTPAGVGAGLAPPRFLKDGDTVISRVEGIGEMHHYCLSPNGFRT